MSWIIALVGRFLIPRVLGAELFGELAFIDSVATLTLSVMAFGVGDYIQKELAHRPGHAADSLDRCGGCSSSPGFS